MFLLVRAVIVSIARSVTARFVPNGEKRNISRYDASEMWNGLNNNVSEDIDRLFTKLESIQGKAISKETTTLKWK